MGYRTLAHQGAMGCSLVLEVVLDNSGNFSGGRMIPLKADEFGIPRPDPNGETIELIRTLMRQDFPQNPPYLSSNGEICGETLVGKSE